MNITVTIDTSDRLQRVLDTFAAALGTPAPVAPQPTTVYNITPPPTAAPQQTEPPVTQTAPQATQTGLPTTAPSYDINQIMQAAGIFAETSDQAYNAAIGLLGKYGISELQALPREQWDAFVMDLRALGAVI